MVSASSVAVTSLVYVYREGGRQQQSLLLLRCLLVCLFVCSFLPQAPSFSTSGKISAPRRRRREK